MTCRTCYAALPPRPPGKAGQPSAYCDDNCRRIAAREQCRRSYRKHKFRRLDKNRAWQAANRERTRRYNAKLRRHNGPEPRLTGKQRLIATMRAAAVKEARRLGIDQKVHWLRWLSGSLHA